MKQFSAQLMPGSDGNKVAIFPDLAMVVVITNTNCSTSGMHELTDKIVLDFVLAAVRQ